MYRVVPRHDACQEVFGICGPARRGIYSKKHFVESEILFWCFQKQSTSFFGFFFGVNGFVRNKNPVAQQTMRFPPESQMVRLNSESKRYKIVSVSAKRSVQR